MAANLVTTTYLKDYTPPAYLIDKTFLAFSISEGATRVSSRLLMRRNPMAAAGQPLVLNGQDLQLLSIAIDDKPLSAADYQLGDETLTIASVPEAFTLRCETQIHPEKNTSLEGLYRSRTMYCTQCEAEGFRKITYYLDRPDVMSEFETTIIADAGSFSTMLSNGNCVADVEEGGKRKVTWHDPFPKPCYLFALVAGNLSCIEDHFVTCSGRDVTLQIFVEEKDLEKCEHAMASLKNAMRWDEEVYGREYDLDIFMIVAVDDFNMGAMENKGLNIFNTSCVLAHPQTTTDAGFQRVEAVVAHEYFHNWSGNRVTCRDWFQLSLKEGFTVYRDAEFSADMNSRAVKRIEDVSLLRTVQFAEDAGPMAHPVRPDSYMEISNFYTVTIYEKGSEVVRMLANILGPQKFREATDLYFSRFDGQAVTCEDFVQSMEEVSGFDLTQFRHWYSQAGTPELTIADSYDAESQCYSLSVKQATPATPGQPHKLPFHIPCKVSLYGEAGAFALNLQGQLLDAERADNTELVLDITEAEQQFLFTGLSEKPTPSLLRGFSAPVKIHYDYSAEQLAHLMQMDSDGFSRWDASQSLIIQVLQGVMQGQDVSMAETLLLSACKTLLEDASLDAAMVALMLTLPAESYLMDLQQAADPALIHQTRRALQLRIAEALEAEWRAVYQRLAVPAQGQSGDAIAARSLRNVALGYLMLLGDEPSIRACWQQYQVADNMTNRLAALRALVNTSAAQQQAEAALADFYQQWQGESLVVNMWLQVQASCELPGTLARVEVLLQHPAFDYTNPNKVRALVAGFATGNPAAFHADNGEGYRFLADQVLHLNHLNPQIASRLLTPLTRWRGIEPVRAALMKQELQRIMADSTLSKDVYEVVSKSLAV